MTVFRRDNGSLLVEGVAVAELAQAVGTPFYVYSRAAIVERFRALREAFAEITPLVCFSVKSNSNLAVLDLLRREGAGFDVVSEGELHRARKIGAAPSTIVFAGVGKTDDEIEAALEAGVRFLNVESEEELAVVDGLARRAGKRAEALLRINPDVDALTHPHITTGRKENKFGVDLDAARRIFTVRQRFENVSLRGLHCHIGSQITAVEPFVAAIDRIAALVGELRGGGARIDALDLGGGFGIEYEGRGLPLATLAAAIVPRLRDLRCEIVLEPGRAIVGAAGLLVARVLYKKHGAERPFLVLDAGMTELIRPALYGAWHAVEPVALASFRSSVESVDLVGPICESSDVLARDRALPPLERGDLVAFFQAGAYGFTMASNYNSRPRPPEILVDGENYRVVRRRETLDDLIRGE